MGIDGIAQFLAFAFFLAAFAGVALVVAAASQGRSVRRGVILAAVYLLYMVYGTFFGELDQEENRTMRDMNGREVLLMLPMEPNSYPQDDPGPHTMLTSLGPAANRDRLQWVLSRGVGYVGLVDHMGSRFTSAPEALRPVLETLDARGLMFVDSRSTEHSVVAGIAEAVGLPHTAGDRFIDVELSRAAIDQALRALDAVALERGTAVGIARPYPLTFERLAAWLPTLPAKGLVLAPVTAVATRPPDP